jgi:hypothetical protein
MLYLASNLCPSGVECFAVPFSANKRSAQPPPPATLPMNRLPRVAKDAKAADNKMQIKG